MKQKLCTCGKYIQLDDEDFLRFESTTLSCRGTDNVCVRLAGRRVALSALITGRLDEDHADRNIHNNQRSNLRQATRSQQGANRDINKNNTSGYKGVCHEQNKPKPWHARIMVKGKQISLGYYLTAKEAALAYNVAAKAHFGEFAFQNSL